MKKMKAYPICLVGLDRRRTVVVGGGKVAERKVVGLLEAGAQVTVIGPTQTARLRTWSEKGAIALLDRPYRQGDLSGAFLVIAATDDPQVNQAVCREAQALGCLVNSVEKPERSDYIVPAVIRRGDITVSISTGGASPALARHLRQRIEQALGPEYAALAALLADLRPFLVEHFAGAEERSAAVERLLSLGILEVLRDAGESVARRHALDWLAPPATGDA